MGFFKSVLSTISKGLEKTRKVLLADVRSFLPGRTVDEALLKQLEVALLKADMGVAVTTRLIASIRKDALEGKISRGEQVLDHLKADLRALWPAEHRELHFAPAGSTTVILVAGVNGAGKTTSVAKIAKALRDQGKSVLLAACDTYRAGAVRQLEVDAAAGVEPGLGAPSHVPGARPRETGDATQQRGLASAGGTGQRGDAASFERDPRRERHAVERQRDVDVEPAHAGTRARRRAHATTASAANENSTRPAAYACAVA